MLVNINIVYFLYLLDNEYYPTGQFICRLMRFFICLYVCILLCYCDYKIMKVFVIENIFKNI